MEVDSGAKYSLISKSDFDKVQLNVNIEPANIQYVFDLIQKIQFRC